jgi:FAD-dependent urate hydroxylase
MELLVDVLIVAAGVGGLALAGGLVRDGHRVRVLEAAAGLREDGAAVTIFSNGAAALAGLGAPLPDPAGPHGFGAHLDRLEFRSPDDRRMFRADLRVLPRRTGFAVTSVPRRRLIQHLARPLPPGTITFDHPAKTVHMGGTDHPGETGRSGGGASPAGVRDGRPAVVDRAGGVHRADVVVGADGVGSVVRRAVLPDSPARDHGWTTWQGLTPVLPELVAGSTGVCVVGDAGLVGLLPAGEGLLQWWFDVEGPRPDPATTSVAGWLREKFSGYAGLVAELLTGISDADLGRYPHALHDVPDAWGTGAVTLLGDAAHAFPPSQAQGANQALEDAWTLRRALSGGGDPVAALRRYERERAPRVRRVSRRAATESTNRPPNTATRLATRLLPPAVTGRTYLTLLRSFSTVLTAGS